MNRLVSVSFIVYLQEAGYAAESPPPAYNQYVGEETAANRQMPPSYSATTPANDMGNNYLIRK